MCRIFRLSSRWIQKKLLVGDYPLISACYLEGMTHGLPAHDLRHSFQSCVRNMTCDITGRSKGTYVPSTLLQCHYWVGGPSGTTLLPSPSLDYQSLCWLYDKWACSIRLCMVVLCQTLSPHPRAGLRACQQEILLKMAADLLPLSRAWNIILNANLEILFWWQLQLAFMSISIFWLNSRMCLNIFAAGDHTPPAPGNKHHWK